MFKLKEKIYLKNPQRKTMDTQIGYDPHKMSSSVDSAKSICNIRRTFKQQQKSLKFVGNCDWNIQLTDPFFFFFSKHYTCIPYQDSEHFQKYINIILLHWKKEAASFYLKKSRLFNLSLAVTINCIFSMDYHRWGSLGYGVNDFIV